MALKIKNRWVGYVTRSLEQFMASLRAKLPTDLPEITDHSSNNPFIYRLKVWGGLLEALSYYIDSAARNVFAFTTRRPDTAFLIAEQNDYRTKGRVPATVDLLFMLDGNTPTNFLIPKGTQVSSVKGIDFYTLEDATILAGTDNITVAASQEETVGVPLPVIIGTTNGSLFQSFEIPDDKVSDVIKSVEVGTTPYTSVDTFAYSIDTSEVYRARQKVNGRMEVVLGDGINGILPTSGQDVSIVYGITEGKDGNVGENELNQVVTALVPPASLTLSVNNPLAASGGTNADSLATIPRKVANHRQTLERAVSPADHGRIAELAAGVGKAGAKKRECNEAEVFIVPTGGGIASSALRASTEAFFIPDKKMIGIELKVRSAGELRARLVISLRIRSGFDREAVKQAVIDNLVEWGDESNQTVSGELSRGDIFEVIEDTEGVINSDLDVFTSVPYAFPVDHDTQLNWNRTVLSGSVEFTQFKIRIQSATNYALFKNGTFLGSKVIGDTVNLPEIEFTVNAGSYTVGETWEFNTYPFNKSITAGQEMSIPTVIATDLDFSTVTGGS